MCGCIYVFHIRIGRRHRRISLGFAQTMRIEITSVANKTIRPESAVVAASVRRRSCCCNSSTSRSWRLETSRASNARTNPITSFCIGLRVEEEGRTGGRVAAGRQDKLLGRRKNGRQTCVWASSTSKQLFTRIIPQGAMNDCCNHGRRDTSSHNTEKTSNTSVSEK